MKQYNDTKYQSIEETLNAIGKAAFVRFYYDFKDTTIPTDVLAEKILRESPLARSAKQGFRIPRARHIFALGKQIEALEIIIRSERVDYKARELAKQILLKEQVSLDFTQEAFDEKKFLQSINEDIIYTLPADFEYDNSPSKPKSLSEVKSNITKIKTKRK